MHSTEAPSSASEKFPAEIWLEIFEQMPRSTDLHSVSVACRKFRDLTVRALHRDLVWLNPNHAIQNLELWNENPGMESLVRSLTLGTLSALRHKQIFARVQTFTSIESLTLTHATLEDVHFGMIHSLPQLRSLRLETCALPSRISQSYNHSNLPITELTMVGLHRGRDSPPVLYHQIVEDLIVSVLSMCTARNLTRLTVDPSADVFRIIYNARDAQARGWAIPRTLEHVYIVHKRGQPETFLSPVLGAELPPDLAFPDTHLYHFCVQAPNLKTVSTPIFVPSQVTIALEALPMGLERFSAPLETAQLIAVVRDVQALGLLKCGVGAREGITALTNVAFFRPGLKMLLLDFKVYFKGWDGEILSAVTQLFKELRRLKLVFEGPGPGEDFLVSLAPEFLAELPHLHTLELYEWPSTTALKPEYPEYLFDPSFESVEEELRNLIIPWNRYCPKLRKVQLHAGYIMTRGFDGGAWNLERVRQLENVMDLDY